MHKIYLLILIIVLVIVLLVGIMWISNYNQLRAENEREASEGYHSIEAGDYNLQQAYSEGAEEWIYRYTENQIYRQRRVYYGEETGWAYFPTEVQNIPSGFMPLDSTLYALNQERSGVLNYTVWKNDFTFIDVDEIDFATLRIPGSNDIVRGRCGNLYVNESRLSWIVERAINTFDMRYRIHDIGDTIQLRRSAWNSFNFVITSIERSNVDEEVLYEIKFMISPSISEKDMPYLFIHAELRDGTTNDNFIIIDEETVHIQISNSEEISLIMVQSPNRHLGRQDTTRKIRIGQWYEGKEEYSVDVDSSTIDS